MVTVALVLLMVSLTTQAQEMGDEAVADLAAAAALERSQEIGARQQAIEDLQSELGVYDPALIEAYSDFAAYYAELGDYTSAIELYDSALQVARISNGPYSEEQLPVLELLIANNRQLLHWQEADNLEHLRHHISSRLYSDDDPRFLQSATSYGDWKLRVVRENLLDLGSRGLAAETEDLSEFYDTTIAAIEASDSATQEDLLQMIYGKSLADMALARVVASTPYTAFQGTVSQFVYETRCQNVINAQGQVVRQCYSVQVENPRYRSSQQQAKEMAVSEYAREVNRSIEKLQGIMAQSANLTVEQRASLESHIGELQTESMLLQRSSRRRLLF